MRVRIWLYVVVTAQRNGSECQGRIKATKGASVGCKGWDGDVRVGRRPSVDITTKCHKPTNQMEGVGGG